MALRKIAAAATVACAAVALAACVAQPPAAQTTVSPAIAMAPSAAPVAPNWQWSASGPAVFLNATDNTSAGMPAASLSLICNNAVPSVMVAWDTPVASGGLSSLTYRFDSQTGRDVTTEAAGHRTQLINDPVAVSRFIDQAAHSRQLAVYAGGHAATFNTTDPAGNLIRFRSACPNGMN